MAAAPLTSNHVNYLIWRYLQESGHDRTAARLQRDWKIGDPETLPFARHIRTHALVSLVQKGLQYHELENSLQQNGERAAQTPATLFFGTDSADLGPPKEASDASSIVKAPPSPRKHARESVAAAAAAAPAMDGTGQAPAPKRPRRTAREAAAASAGATKSGDEMDVDQPRDSSEDAENADAKSEQQVGKSELLVNGRIEESTASGIGHDAASAGAAASAALTPPPPRIATLETGTSKASQTDAVREISKQVTQVVGTGPSKGLIITAWNPHQPNLLASAGDGHCRLLRWPVPDKATAPATNGIGSNAPAPQHTDLFGDGSMANATITALTWSPDGEQLAVAKHPNDQNHASSVITFYKDGSESDSFGESQHFFFGLAYNSSGSLLLGYGGDNTHYDDGSRDYGLCVFTLDDSQDTDYSTGQAMLTVPRQVIAGAVWLDDSSIVACGPGFIGTTQFVDGRFQPLQPVAPAAACGDPSDPHEWSFMSCDKFSGACVFAAEAQGRLALLDPDRKSLYVQDGLAHSGSITGIQFQPLRQHGSTGNGPRLVASASDDGAVKLWDAADQLKLLRVMHCDSFDPVAFPALAMQFSPDGSTLAAGSTDLVVFWKPELAGSWPSATWRLNGDDKHFENTGENGFMGAGALARAGNGDSRPRINGSLVNGINGHARTNGANGPLAVDADRMSVDGEEKPRSLLSEGEGAVATLTWSAMGKKIAYWYGEQIYVADYSKASIQ